MGQSPLKLIYYQGLVEYLFSEQLGLLCFDDYLVLEAIFLLEKH